MGTGNRSIGSTVKRDAERDIMFLSLGKQRGVTRQGVTGAMVRAVLLGYARRDCCNNSECDGCAGTFSGVVERGRGLKCRVSGGRAIVLLSDVTRVGNVMRAEVSGAKVLAAVVETAGWRVKVSRAMVLVNMGSGAVVLVSAVPRTIILDAVVLGPGVVSACCVECVCGEGYGAGAYGVRLRTNALWRG